MCFHVLTQLRDSAPSASTSSALPRALDSWNPHALIILATQHDTKHTHYKDSDAVRQQVQQQTCVMSVVVLMTIGI